MSVIIKTLFIILYILLSTILAGVIGIVFNLPDTPFVYITLLTLFLGLPIFLKLSKNKS
ncbi:hypothetical protein JCM11957_06690 [Caminibacter profundus]